MQEIVSGNHKLAESSLQSIAGEIRERIRDSVIDIIWIGRVLSEAEHLILEMKRMGKRPIPFARWVKEEVRISLGTAKNYRDLFHKYESSERVAKLEPEIALLLCSSNIPKEAVDRVIEEVDTGRTVTRKEVRVIVEEFTGKARERSEGVRGIPALLEALSRLFDQHRDTLDHAISTEDSDGLRKLHRVLMQYANSIGVRVQG